MSFATSAAAPSASGAASAAGASAEVSASAAWLLAAAAACAAAKAAAAASCKVAAARNAAAPSSPTDATAAAAAAAAAEVDAAAALAELLTPPTPRAASTSVAAAAAEGSASMGPPAHFSEPRSMRSIMSMGVLQTGQCLSWMRCLSMLQCGPCSEFASAPTTWKRCMQGNLLTLSPGWKHSKQMGQASRNKTVSSLRTSTDKVWAVIISWVANGISRGSTMCITQATIEVYHIRKVCATKTKPHVWGNSAGQSTSYSRVKTLLRPAPPGPHFKRVYRFVAFHSFATKYRCSSPIVRRLSSKIVCNFKCCEPPSSCVPWAR
mmetsp:Transcript_9915/g.22239  ORF Transcript_9915/g.22239 Transcript_9915/m.22239 type:complete len:321 (-) Transcript_9915:621-1583(-)